MASNSKRSRDDKTKFTEAEKNWNLEKLYEDLRGKKQKVLTDTEKCHLRGLLCGYSPQEIAKERVIEVGTINDALSKTLYRYIEGLLNSEKKIRHWSHVTDFLEKAGYKIQVSEQFQPSNPLTRKNDNTFELSHQSEAAVNASASNLSAEQYKTLEKLLKAGKWREADEETNNLMVKVAGREKEGWLDSLHIEEFPCSDLRAIDTLWVKYSQEHFGFSVQTRIWHSVGRAYEPDGEIYERFCECVGWSKKLVVGNKVVEGIVDYLSYCDLIFNLSAPMGQLPSGIILGRKWRSWGELGFWGGSAVIFSRVQACGL